MERVSVAEKINRFVLEHIDPQSTDEANQLLQAFAETISIRKLSRLIDISAKSLSQYLRSKEVVVPSQAAAVRQMLTDRWQDLEFRQRQATAVRQNWQDLEFRQRNAAAVRQMLTDRWQDLEFRQRNATATRQMLTDRWQDLEFRQRHAAATRQMLTGRWQDLEFRERNAAATRQNWQDLEFRQRQATAVRHARLNPNTLHHYSLPTIHGIRLDIGYAQSTWEANLFRILALAQRDYSTHFDLTLTIPTEYQATFNTNQTTFQLDSLSIDPRGRFIGHEIMAHPYKDPQGWLKLELAISQYPQIIFRPITQTIYQRLQRRFANQINLNLTLAGWETSQDNLRTNPTKYAHS